jgi:ABC-type antimicrobial peptide transport system ATPase subunit
VTKIKELTTEELELLIEQKVSEIIGDPDSGLELSEDFRKQLKQRLETPSGKITQEEVERKFG